MRLTLVLLFLSQLIAAQNFSGIVLDIETNKPIEDVIVYFEKKSTGTITDTFGTFKLTIESITSKADSLQFSLIGYHTKNIALTKFTNTKTVVYLSKKLESLNVIVINTSKNLKTNINYKTLAALKFGVYAFGSQIINNYIYVVSGNSSYVEDSGKRALEVVNDLPEASFGNLLKELQRGFNYEAYTNKLQIYNINNDTWSVSETKFRKRAFQNLNRFDNSLYSLGGKRLSASKKYEYLDDKIEVFDLGSKAITIDDTNPHQAINFASFTYQDNIIVMGGSTKLKRNGEKVFTDEAHIYNITSGIWYELAKMTFAKETQGVLIDNKIYLIGGNDGRPLKTIESYNINTGTWTNEGDLFIEMEQPGLTTHDNIIYIFNDEKLLTYNTITKTLEEYDINLKLKNSKLHYYQNKLYIVGGFTENSNTIAVSSKSYVIDLDEFYKTKPNNSKGF
jgi:hypothetical protein